MRALADSGIPLLNLAAHTVLLLALALARDPDRLGALGDKLTANLATAPLFDTDRTRRQVEAACGLAWRRHLAGLEPRSFDVPPDT